MLRWSVVVLTLVILLGFGACAPQLQPQESCHFSQNNQKQRVSWKGHLPIQLYFHSSVPKPYYEAIQRAMKTWEDELHQPVFVLAGLIDNRNEPVEDGYSVLYWMDRWEADHYDEQARTTIYWQGSEIREADIMVNAVNHSFSGGLNLVAGAIDVESLLLHELGHALGLAHNHQLGSIMAETLSLASERRKLANADRESISCEYK